MIDDAPVKRLLTILRRDGGLHDEAEQAAQLAWMLFLKAVDEHETEREILVEHYRSPIPAAFRWRNWASDIEARGADALIPFLDRALFPALRELPANKDALTRLVREVALIARNFMRSGALLAEAIRYLDGVDFQHLTARRALAEDFEQQVREILRLRGLHLFTPPSLAHSIMVLLDPELGETILDPHFGYGGYLVAAVDRLRDQWIRLPEHEEDLARTLLGTEQTALGWLIASTQLLLRDVIPTARILHANPIARPLAEIGSGDRADVIAGTLPFAGHVDVALLQGFPPMFHSTDPALLYLVLSMQLLRPGGRAAVVVPDHLLSSRGVSERVRQRLLEDFDLHTIVRLPSHTFMPHAGLHTSILFFTQGSRTREVWHYEHRVPDGLSSYSKRRLPREEDFAPLLSWWSDRRETEVAFRAPLETIEANDFNLDLRHPRRAGTALLTEAAAAKPSDPPQIVKNPSPSPPAPAYLDAGHPVRLRGLELRDFRGFSRLDLELPASGPAVFIGINGAGKSTVLDAIGHLLAMFAARACGLSTKAASSADLLENVRAGQEAASVGLTLSLGGQDQYWELRLNRIKGKATWGPELSRQASVLRDQLLHRAALSVPVLCAYAATRGFHDGAASRQANLPFPQLRAYEGAFRRGLGPFSDFLHWFRQEEDQENEIRLREDSAHRSRSLEVVRRAVKGFMGELGAGYFSDLRIERGAGRKSGEGALILEKSGVPLRIADLSDGEKGTLLLVSDLARRFAVAHAHREDPLRGDGVVLIDELDRDLHPGWQRAFLPALTATFPGCQFLASTHSPHVLSGVRKENVFLLEDFALQKAPYTYGRDANSILNEAMGVPDHPREIEAKIREIGVLLDKERFDEARRALDELGAILGDQDSEVVRLKTLAAFLEG